MDYQNLRDRDQNSGFYLNLKEQSQAFANAKRFARCAVNMSAERSRLFLDQDAPYKSPKKLTDQQFFGRFKGCAPAQMHVDRDFIRGTLAEEVVLQTIPVDGLKAATSGAQVTEFVKKVAVEDPSTDKPLTATQLTTECRVAMAPGPARSVLETEPGSDEEKSALATLAVLTPQCNLFVDVAPMTGYFQRAFIARGLYYWSDFVSRNK